MAEPECIALEPKDLTFSAYASAPRTMTTFPVLPPASAKRRDAPVPPGQRPPAKLAGQLTAWARKRGLDVDPAVAHRAIVVWSRLHGLVSLEIEGNFASMGVDAELLLDEEIAALSGQG